MALLFSVKRSLFAQRSQCGIKVIHPKYYKYETRQIRDFLSKINWKKYPYLSHDQNFIAVTIQCGCQKIRLVFRIIGIYHFVWHTRKKEPLLCCIYLHWKKRKLRRGCYGYRGVKRCPTSITIEQKDKETCKNHSKRAFWAGGAGLAIAPLEV